MANHDASAQVLGYIYQTQCALFLLMTNEDIDMNICIEKFDDITFHKDEEPFLQLQIKYHSSDDEITDTSTDFWRTIKVWIDCIRENPNLLQNTTFCIMTTNTIAKNSIIEKIQMQNDSIDNIYSELFELAKKGKNNCKSDSSYTYKCYDAFLSIASSIAKKLLQCIKIKPSNPEPISMNEKILKKLQLFTSKQSIQIVYDRLLGWWYRKMVECLSSEKPLFISFNELRTEIVVITSELKDDNLPNDVTDKEIEIIKKSNDVKILIKQLEFISSKQTRVNTALKDYYKSCAQRSKWIRENLITSEELDQYDERLFNEWDFQFSESTNIIDKTSDDSDKIKAGNKIYLELMKQDNPIRKNFTDKTITRGSFHELANEKTIGWHPDYLELLKNEGNIE